MIMNYRLKVYVIEPEENRELVGYISKKYIVTSVDKSDVIIVSSVKNASKALNIVGCGLDMGKEILCIKSKSKNKNFVSSLLIQEGALWV